MTAIAERPVSTGAPGPPEAAHRAAEAARSTCSRSRTRRAGGRASWRPTSRWTPRTCCCASSWASGPDEPRRRGRAGSAPSNAPTGPGPPSTAARRPVHDRRGLRRAAPGRRRPGDAAHAAAPRLRPASRRASRRTPGVHPDLAGAVRPVALGRPAGDAARADAAAEVVPAQRLRLGLLGPPDRRADHGRLAPPPGAAAAVRRSTSCAPATPGAAPATTGSGAALSRCSTGRSRATSGRRSSRCASAAFASAAEWILARQEADGGWGGIQPPWVYSIMALHLLGYPLDHPVSARGLAGLDGFPDPRRRRRPARLEACQSPVWDTALALVALPTRAPARRPGVRARPPTGCSARRSRVKGDWSVRRPELAAGGWAFEFANDGYPDTDDTAEVVLALRGSHRRDPAASGARSGARHRAGSMGMQSADGGWGAFDADNTRALVDEAAVLRLRRGHRPAVGRRHRARRRDARRARQAADSGRARGVSWLLDAQEADGSWFGRWGANYVYGTGAVVPALIAAGVPPRDPALRRAVALARSSIRTPDGGWGEDLRSYVDPRVARPRRLAPPRRPRGRCSRCWPAARDADAVDRAACSGWRRPSAPDGTWDEDLSPAPASPATSTSTTTCTGLSSRSAPSAVRRPLQCE